MKEKNTIYSDMSKNPQNKISKEIIFSKKTAHKKSNTFNNNISQETKILFTSNLLIIFIYIISFLIIIASKEITKILSLNIDFLENLLIIFFICNILTMFINLVMFQCKDSCFHSYKNFFTFFSNISKLVKNSCINFFFVIYSIKIAMQIKNISIKDIANKDNMLLKIRILSDFNMFYYFNLIYTNLIIWLNYGDNKTISYILILIMLIPNFFNLIVFEFYLYEIVQLSFLVISSLFMIFIRDKIFSEFSEENKFESSRPITEESAIKKEDINNEKIISENEFNLPELNDFSNFYYFYFFKNKIYGINENFKSFLKENSDKIIYDYDKSDKFTIYLNFNNLKSNSIINYNNNLNNDLPLNIELDDFEKDSEKYKKIEEDKNLKICKSFIEKIKFFKKINKNYEKEIHQFFKNYFQKNNIEKIEIKNSLREKSTNNYHKINIIQNLEEEIIELDNSLKEDFDKKIEDFIAINKGESLFTLIDNTNKVLKHYNLVNKKNSYFKNENNTFIKRHKSFIRKEKSLTIENSSETNKELNNSSFQNFISKNNKNEFKEGKKKVSKFLLNQNNVSSFNNNIILNIDENESFPKEFKIYDESIDLNLKKSQSYKKKNYENNINKNDEIIDKKNSIRSILRDVKQIVNIGIFTLQLVTIKKNEKNQSNKENLKNTMDKIDYNDLNTRYYDISIILNLICRKKNQYKIEFIIKDVSKYYKSNEKLKNISNSNYLNISNLIHEFKTPLNCIIGLSDESQLLIGSSKKNLVKNFDLIKDDIERINGLSNYTVFLIKDLTDYLQNLNENKKLDENDKSNNFDDDDEFLEKNKNNTTSKDLNNNSEEKTLNKYLEKGISQKSKKQKSIPKNKINLNYYNLIDILSFSFSILTSLIKCSKLKSKTIYPKLSISEEIKNLMIYTDEIKLKQILLNLISNSVKFTNSGYIEIEAKYNDDFSKNFFEINVKDTGIGINKNEQHKIFQDYSNIHHDKSQKNNNIWGTGLGLSLSKRIASLMDMDLTYDFTYKNGSKFNIIIPIEKLKNEYNNANIIIHTGNKILNKKNNNYMNGENHISNISSSKISFGSKLNNNNNFTNRDKSKNSFIIDSFTKQDTNVFMSGIRIINSNNLNNTNSNFDVNLSENIDSSSKRNKSTNNNNYPYKNRYYAKSHRKTDKSLKPMKKKKKTFNNLEKCRTSLIEYYNYDKSKIQNKSGLLEKAEEIFKINQNKSPYKQSYSNKKIQSSNLFCLNSFTPRTIELSMPMDFRINPDLKNKLYEKNLKLSNLDHSNNSNFSSNISNNSISLDNISKYENKLENSFRSIRTYIKEKLDLENEYHLEIKKKNDRFKTSQKNIYDLMNNDKRIKKEVSSGSSIISLNSRILKEEKPKSKILIVDDNDILLRTLNKMLFDLIMKRNENIEIIKGDDGLDILNYIIKDQFNGNLIKCIITDENMEFINGTEAIGFLNRLHRRNKIRSLSVIILSSYEDNYIKKVSLTESWRCEYMSKPISINQLEKKLIDMNIFTD